jgi:thymidylate kinase
MTINILEGIDYSGKTTAVNIIMKKFDYRHYVLNLSPEEKKQIHGLVPEDRLNAFNQLNKKLYSRVLSEHSNGTIHALIERCWPSTIAYHNILLKRHLEEEAEIQENMLAMKPDQIILITTDIDSVKRRMENRPPGNKYESDPKFLIDVQEEYVRLLNYTYEKMNIPFIIIKNSTDNLSDLEKSLDILKHF